MAEISRFFADVAGDRLTTAAQWNRIFDQLLQEKDGVIRGLGNTLAVTNSGAVAVDVNTGSAIMGGRPYENTASKNLVLDAVTSGSKRYDRIVVRVDETARTMVLTVIKGVEGASPSVPAIDGTTDVLLAKILLDRSSGSYVYTVTDERVYCDGLLLPAIIAKLNAGTFSPDDLADGTTYKRVLAAVATALNAGTYDAAKVSAFGVGSVAKVLTGADDVAALTGTGFYTTNGVQTDTPWAGENIYVIHIQQGASYAIQVAFRLTGGVQAGMKMRVRTNTSTWSAWSEIFNSYSDGNDGQQPAAKSNKTSNATIGWFDAIDVASGASATFPSGGQFEWWIPTYGATYNGVKSGINAGGALSGTASANLTIYYKRLSA